MRRRWSEAEVWNLQQSNSATPVDSNRENNITPLLPLIFQVINQKRGSLYKSIQELQLIILIYKQILLDTTYLTGCIRLYQIKLGGNPHKYQVASKVSKGGGKNNLCWGTTSFLGCFSAIISLLNHYSRFALRSFSSH